MRVTTAFRRCEHFMGVACNTRRCLEISKGIGTAIQILASRRRWKNSVQQLSSVNEDNISGRIHEKGKKAPAVHRHREIFLKSVKAKKQRERMEKEDLKSLL